MGINEVVQIGNRIKEYRKSKGITQKELALHAGIPYSTYSNYENNNREPNREQLQKIATALDVPLYELMGFDGSIRVNITPEAKEINRIQNKLLSDRENVTKEELEILKNYYTSKQLKAMAGVLDTSDNMLGNITSSDDIVYVDSDVLEYNKIIDKQKSGGGFTSYDKRFISDYIDKSPLVREWFIENGLKSKEQNLERIQSAYEHLNENGRKEAVKRIEELTEIKRYAKPDKWFKGKPTKEEIDSALRAYLNDNTTTEPPQE